MTDAERSKYNGTHVRLHWVERVQAWVAVGMLFIVVGAGFISVRDQVFENTAQHRANAASLNRHYQEIAELKQITKETNRALVEIESQMAKVVGSNEALLMYFKRGEPQ